MEGRRRSTAGWFCVLLLLPVTAGCIAAPSEPLNAPLGLRRSGDDYFIRLAGSCTYPDGTSLVVRLGDGSTLFQVTLKAGSTTNEIRIGDVASARHVGMPFTGFPAGRRVVDVLAGSGETGWDNEFTLPIADGTMNGGTEFDNKPVGIHALEGAARC